MQHVFKEACKCPSDNGKACYFWLYASHMNCRSLLHKAAAVSTVFLSLTPTTCYHQLRLPSFDTATANALSFGSLSFAHTPCPEGQGGGVGLTLSQCCPYQPLPTPPSLSLSTFEVHSVSLFSAVHL